MLAEAGAVDDRSYARRYAEDKRTLAGWGTDRIRAALEGKGVPGEHIEAALADEGPEEQLTRAAALLASRGQSVATERERERALGLLIRRGYPLELAYEAIRAAEKAA